MLTTAFILGLAGSLHCVGMCSPLAFAVTNNGNLFSRLLYNGGRILMYCLMGAVISSVGAMFPPMVQYIISAVLGISLLVIGITGSNFRTPVFAPFMKITNFLKLHFSRLLQKKNQSTIFAMGILNGLLPCGLTFLALTSSITLDGPLGGFIFMAAFGAGTLPVMLGLVSAIPFFANRFNFRLSKLSVAMQLIAGCLLIVRVLLVDSHLPMTTTAGVDSITICP